MPPINNRPSYPRPNLFNPQERPHHFSAGRPVSTHQQEFLNDVGENAEYNSNKYSNALYARGEQRGYSKADVDAGLQRISTSHSTINFNPAAPVNGGSTVMDSMANDEFYRNIHETGHSQAQLSGGQRTHLEQGLFNSHYRGVPAYAHPSYGALNVTNNPHGAAPQAGDSHLRIKPQVHNHATFTHFDSALANRYDNLGTSKHNKHVLHHTTNHTFDNVMGRRPSSPADPRGDYIEVQYHGKLRFGEDVDSLNVPSKYSNTEVGNSAREFRDNHGTKLYWVDPSGQRRPSYGGGGGYDRDPGYYR